MSETSGELPPDEETVRRKRLACDSLVSLPILALRSAGHSLRSSVPSFVGPVHSVHSRCAGRGW